jgi:hypothetical protein
MQGITKQASKQANERTNEYKTEECDKQQQKKRKRKSKVAEYKVHQRIANIKEWNSFQDKKREWGGEGLHNYQE